eukprot:scaffold67460_cov73-Phaeocystis_antarctica.AAC.1
MSCVQDTFWSLVRKITALHSASLHLSVGLSVIVPRPAFRRVSDGRASTRHLHGITERAACCNTVKIPASRTGRRSREITVRSQTRALGGRPDQPAGAPGIPSG